MSLRFVVAALASLVAVAAPVGAACTTQPADETPPVDEPVDEEVAAPVVDDPRVAAIVRAFDDVASGCADRVWTGHSWNDDRVVLFSRQADRAWIWSGADLAGGAPSIEEVEPASLPLDLRDFDLFSFAELDGASAIGIDLDGTAEAWMGEGYADFALHLAFHEGFHFLGGQDDFSSTDTSGRDPALPQPWEPRFMRERILDGSKRALAGDAAGKGDAKHWLDAHAASHPEDAAELGGLDVIEGTAQYVETVSVIVAKLGCDATDAEIVAEAAAHADLFVMDPGFEKGGESYAIGPVAGLLLRGAVGQSFEHDAKGTPMHELLLAGVAANDVVDDDPAVVAARADAEGTVTAQNEDLALRIQPLLTGWDDPSVPRLALPTQAMFGSLAYEGGFVLVEREDDAHVLLGVGASFQTAGGEAELFGENVVEDSGACGGGHFVVPMASAQVTDGRVAVSTDLIEADVAVDVIIVDGHTWLCAR